MVDELTFDRSKIQCLSVGPEQPNKIDLSANVNACAQFSWLMVGFRVASGPSFPKHSCNNNSNGELVMVPYTTSYI